MRLSFGLEARQVQTQKLAPRMIQSMEILQLPQLALEERIEQEVIENPVLEMAESDPNAPDEPAERENPDAPSESEKELVVDEKHDEADFERLLNMDGELPGSMDDSFRPSVNRIEEANDRKHDAMANIAMRPQSLQDYLLEQIGELDLERDLERLCEQIISTLDALDGGYFKASLQDLLPPYAGPDELALAEQALRTVQQLDPPGIAARDLRECLLNQLTPDLDYFEELHTLISDHLEDLRDNRMPLIERKTGYTIDLIQETWQELRKLNPKPGSFFADIHVASVTPDVSVERSEDGKYTVRLEDDRTPSLFISEYYRRRLSSGTATPEEKEFIKRKINSAQWLIESIEQRRSTLTRVSQAIVDYQHEFLDNGPEFIQPLKMQQIAEQVGVHVTTVSRAVGDKWIQTPRGIFPLKRFFVHGTSGSDGDDVAFERIRMKLQELVDEEDKQHPYSDDRLVKELEKHGMKLARRTVTKYREKMGIPSSRQRRDWTQR